MSEWMHRGLGNGDINGLVFLWLKSFGSSRYGKSIGAHDWDSPAEKELWKKHSRIVKHLLNFARVEVLCDPEEPSTIWAFSCTEETEPSAVVHMVVVKKSFTEFRRRMLDELLPKERFGPGTHYTHAMPSYELCHGRMPNDWVFNPYLVAYL